MEARRQGLVDVAVPVNWACGLTRPRKIEGDDRAAFEVLRAALEPRVRALVTIPGDAGGASKRSRLDDDDDDPNA